MAEKSNTILTGLGFESGITAPDVTPMVSEGTIFKAQEEVTTKGGFFSSLPTAVVEEQIAPILFKSADRLRTPEGEAVGTLTDEMTFELTNGLTDERAISEVLDEATNVNLNSAMRLRKDYLETQTNRQKLADAGWGGTAATFFAAMFDPVEWATIGASTAAIASLSGPAAPLTATTALTAGAAMRAKKAYSAAKAFSAGAAVTGLELAAFESIRAGLKYDVDANDVLIAMGAGSALGGTLNAGISTFIKRGNVARLAKKVAEGGQLTPAERAFYNANNAEATTQRLINETMANDTMFNVADATTAATRVSDTGVSERVALAATPEETAEAIPEIAGFGLLGVRKLVSSGYKAGMSKLSRMRQGARALGANTVGYKGGNLHANDSASEIAERIQGQYRQSFGSVFYPAQEAFIKRTGLSIPDFNDLVSKYVRGIITEADPEVKAVAELVQKQERELAEMGIKYDVAGFTPSILDKHKNYLARIFNDENIVNLRKRLGADADEKIAQLVEEALRKGQPDILDNVIKSIMKKAEKAAKKKPSRKSTKDIEAEANDMIRRIAAGYTKGIIDRSFGKSGGVQGLNEMTLEDLGDLMKREFKDELSSDQIDDVVELFANGRPTKAEHKRSRPRLLLDESASISVTRADGEVEEIRFEELLETDIEQLHNSYIFQLSGAIGLARNGINTNQAGSSWDAFKETIKSQAKMQNISEGEYRSELDALDFMYDGITGRLAHREPFSKGVKEFNVGMRAFSFAVNMGMSGMSSMMEISNAVFEYSVSTILRTNPAMNSFYTKASQGRMEDSLLKELIDDLGMGEEVLLGKYSTINRFDGGNLEGTLVPRAGWKASKAQWLQQKVAYGSGLLGVTQVLRRRAMRGFAQEWATAATKDKMPFATVKLRQLGLTDDMTTKISNTIKDKADIENGTLVRMNLKDWPEDVRDAFQAAGFKEVRNSVQEMNIASTNKWLRSEIGKTYFQFLSFTMASIEQQTMRLGMRMVGGDLRTVSKVFASSAMLGMMMYTARVQMNAIGRGDADEYIKERMTPKNFAVGALSQIGAASIFGYIYQITTGAMGGNTHAITPPALSYASALLQATQAYNDGKMSEAEYRRILRLAPAQSLYGVRQILNATANQLYKSTSGSF